MSVVIEHYKKLVDGVSPRCLQRTFDLITADDPRKARLAELSPPVGSATTIPLLSLNSILAKHLAAILTSRLVFILMLITPRRATHRLAVVGKRILFDGEGGSMNHNYRGMRNAIIIIGIIIVFGFVNNATTPASAQAVQGQQQQGASTEDLQKAVQNPVANLISVPFQNNIDFGIGPYDRTRNTLNIQPVIPIQLSEGVMLITRTIFPVIIQPDFNTPNGGAFGLGDINPTFFFSPARSGKLIWGIGPAFILPTATDRALGAGKWSAGPSIVALAQPAKWTVGALVSNVWSFAGQESRPAVNAMSIQYFINYNFPKGWYFTSSPIIAGNWRAAEGDRWLVPFGAGIGRVTRIGAAPINWQVGAYANVIRPDTLPSPRWQLRLQLALLYPQKK
jgi:hypothetical protein